MCVSVVVEYADTRFSRVSLQKNKKVCETVFAYSYGAQVESFKENKVVKTRDTVPLKGAYKGENACTAYRAENLYCTHR